MRHARIVVLTLLALGLLVAAPGFAVNTPTDIQIDLSQEEPLMTPAESPELPDILDPSRGTWEEKLLICDLDPDNPCEPNCLCVEIGGAKTCRC